MTTLCELSHGFGMRLVYVAAHCFTLKSSLRVDCDWVTICLLQGNVPCIRTLAECTSPVVPAPLHHLAHCEGRQSLGCIHSPFADTNSLLTWARGGTATLQGWLFPCLPLCVSNRHRDQGGTLHSVTTLCARIWPYYKLLMLSQSFFFPPSLIVNVLGSNIWTSSYQKCSALILINCSRVLSFFLWLCGAWRGFSSPPLYAQILHQEDCPGWLTAYWILLASALKHLGFSWNKKFSTLG